MSISTNIFQRVRVGIWRPRVIGWNQRFYGKSPKVLIGVNHKESPSREVKTKMVLHSEVQAEESHQEQGEYADRLGGHDTST